MWLLAALWSKHGNSKWSLREKGYFNRDGGYCMITVCGCHMSLCVRVHVRLGAFRKPGIKIYICNPRLRRPRPTYQEVMTSLDYVTARPCLKNKQTKGVCAVFTSNLSFQEIEAGGSRVQGHSLLHNKFEASLGYESSYLKNKIQNKHLGSRPMRMEVGTLEQSRLISGSS